MAGNICRNNTNLKELSIKATRTSMSDGYQFLVDLNSSEMNGLYKFRLDGEKENCH